MKALGIFLLLVSVPAFAGHSSQDQKYQPYAMCSGQTDLGDISELSRTGDMSLQLAPMFLDQMAPCRKADRLPPDSQVQAKAGVVTAKGDCDWVETGVSCHYHKGVEFVDSTDQKRPKLGELHCVFPVANDKDSPRVYGGHFSCKAPDGKKQEVAAGLNVGASCGAGLLTALRDELTRKDVRCCDDGVLTATLDQREAAGILGLRPDFRMSMTPMELDCSSMRTMEGRSANAPKYGPPVEDFRF